MTDARCEPPEDYEALAAWALAASKRVASEEMASVLLRQAEVLAGIPALRAERDAAVAERDQFVGLAREAEAAERALRAEVEKLREALKPFADAAPKFRDCGDAIEVADIAHDATFTVGDLRRAATLANAVEVPE